MNISRRGLNQGLLANGVVLATLGGVRAQTAGSNDALIAAAKKEGRVIVYSGYLSPQTHEPIGKAFEQKYGIKVDVFTARGNELRERIRVEQLSGRFLGDVLHNAMLLTNQQIAGESPLDKLGVLPGAVRLKPEFASRVSEFQVPIFTINYGFLVNTNIVKAGDEPKRWQDLLDPKWKGKILFDDPRTPGGGRVLFHMTTDKYGKAFHEEMAKQNPTFSRDYGEAVRRIARGEYTIYIPLIFSQAGPLKGLPVRAIIPEDGVTYGSYSTALLKNAPHPNAARLLANFYLSDEVQAIYAEAGHGYVVKDLAAKISPEMAPFASVKPLVAEDGTRYDAFLALAKEIYK
jgi:iron(III) transport system substrate-binding protein